MAINYYSDDIAFTELKKDLQNSTWHTLCKDAGAAVSVALLTVPQAMAYAILAGLPLSCGLFAAIFSSCIAAFMGASRHMVLGPTNAIAILVQAGTAEILYSQFRDLPDAEKEVMAVQILTQLTLLTGFFQIIVSTCRLGRLTQFVSHSVIVGYMAGTALAVFINQLYPFLGISRLPGVHSLYENGIYLVSHLNQLHVPTFIIGIGCLAVLLTLKKINKRIPAGVIIMVVSAAIVHYSDLSSYTIDWEGTDPYQAEQILTVNLIGDNGEIFELFPHVGFPFFDLSIMNALIPIAFALALLNIMETISVSKAVAANSGQRLSINQEVFGLGIGNLMSAFIMAMPISGSAMRSTVNYVTGAQTRFAAILNTIFVWLIIIVLGFYVNRVPLTALAALLFLNAIHIVNFKQLRICLKATNADSLVLWGTLLSCIFFSFDIAFYIGIAISITSYLKKSAVPQLVEYDIDEQGELRNLDFAEASQQRTIRLIKVEGELFFGAADIFQRTLKGLAEDDMSTRVIILQLKNARDMDATACVALQQLYDYLRGSNCYLILCGITQPVWEVLSDSGLIHAIGKENLFLFDERQPYYYMQKALQRAKELVNESKNGDVVVGEKAVTVTG